MDFGLGLILSLTDNATAGLNNAVNTLERLTKTAEGASKSMSQIASLSALSVVSNQVGNSLLKAGGSILGVFTNLLGKVKDTGSEFESFRMTLQALYGDGEKAENAISKLLDFSIKSPFEVDEVKDMLIVLQSQSVDAFNEITGGITGARQETLSWIADLMAFKPDEATTRWKRALTNYIGSGEDRMLRNILDMGDIDQILGHDIGATVDERLNDIIEIVEKKNLQGLANNLSKTWQGVASNMSDAFTKIYKSVADNGVFDKLKSSFMSVSGAILTLDNDELEALGKTIADALNTIVEPITKVAEKANKFLQFVVNLCQNNPKLAKLGIIAFAVAGALLVLSGVFFKFVSALSSMSVLILTFGSAFAKVKSAVALGVLRLKAVLLPLVATIGLLYFAWKTDFAGIKTRTTEFVSNLVKSFKTASSAVNGSVGDLMLTVRDLNNRDDYFSRLTLGIMKVQMVFKALSDAWGDYELSETNFKKAEELGVLPLITAILMLKYRFERFKEGFRAGWDELGQFIADINADIAESLEGTIFVDLMKGLTDFLSLLASGDSQAWYDFGKSFVEIGSGILMLIGYFKLMSGVALFIDKVVGVFTKLLGIIKTVWGVLQSLWGFFTSVAGGITMTFGGLLLAVTTFTDMWQNGFNKVKAILSIVGGALAGLGLVIAGIASWPAIVVGAIAAAIGVLVIFIKDNCNAIVDFFKKIGKAIGDFFAVLWEGIKADFQTVADIITTVLKNAINSVLTFVGELINGVIWALNKAIDLINMIPGVNISAIPSLEVPQLAMGGVVSTPTTAIIGEAGTEAVVPLENNLGWLSKLAQMITYEMRNITPTNSSNVATNNQGSPNSYMTTNNSSSQVVQDNTDNSVVFNQGAIQVIVQNATEEEAIRLAKKIMEYITRQKQLDRMLHYA